MSRPWVVLKFGGTSVAAAEHWDTIAAEARARCASGRRVLLVCSALSGVTNRLERALAQACAGGGEDELRAIREAHRALAKAGGVAEAGPGGSVAPAAVEGLWDELERWLSGVRLTGEASPRLGARVLALGELASTHLGAALLAARGVRRAGSTRASCSSPRRGRGTSTRGATSRRRFRRRTTRRASRRRRTGPTS